MSSLSLSRWSILTGLSLVIGGMALTARAQEGYSGPTIVARPQPQPRPLPLLRNPPIHPLQSRHRSRHRPPPPPLPKTSCKTFFTPLPPPSYPAPEVPSWLRPRVRHPSLALRGCAKGKR